MPPKKKKPAKMKKAKRTLTKARRKELKKQALEKMARAKDKESTFLARLKQQNPNFYKKYMRYKKAKKSRLLAKEALFEIKVKEGIEKLKKKHGKKLSRAEREFVSDFYFGIDAEGSKFLRRKGYPSLESFAKLFIEYQKKEKGWSTFFFEKFIAEYFSSMLSWPVHSTTYDRRRGVGGGGIFTADVNKLFYKFERENALHSTEAEKFFIERLKEAKEGYDVQKIKHLQNRLGFDLSEKIKYREKFGKKVVSDIIEEIETDADVASTIKEWGQNKENYYKQYEREVNEVELLKRMKTYLLNLITRRWKEIGLAPPERKRNR
jgi:hypothetical protein